MNTLAALYSARHYPDFARLRPVESGGARPAAAVLSVEDYLADLSARDAALEARKAA